jgi:hypothetical protein
MRVRRAHFLRCWSSRLTESPIGCLVKRDHPDLRSFLWTDAGHLDMVRGKIAETTLGEFRKEANRRIEVPSGVTGAMPMG